MPTRIQKNKLVSITYSILNEQGEVVEKSDTPVDYVHGVNDRMFPKIIASLEGKSIGDVVTIILSPQEGFGVEDPNLIIVSDINSAPPKYRVIGAKPTFQNEDGKTLEMEVTKIEDGKITVNGNHPFAGKTMKFVVTVVGVRAPEEGDAMDFSHDATPPTVQ
jgi:FKBP-type peptidyl-prolyl cis-trans isomerase SlyD